MSDYSKSYDGAAKDSAQSTIAGADFDTEFSAIETAIATKTNKVIPTATGNVATLSSTGDLQDSGVTTTELSILDGATVTTAELNILDGVTATTAEINKLDGVTATTAELNILDGVTATAAELNLLDGRTGTVWTSTNDGSGSGLDADTLDGVQGANYARENASNTFTAAQTFSALATFSADALSGKTGQQMALFHGKCDSSGTAILLPSGWSCAKAATGKYTFTHNLGLTTPSTNACITVTTQGTTFGTVPHAGNGPNQFSVWVYNGSSAFTDDYVTFSMYVDDGDASW